MTPNDLEILIHYYTSSKPHPRLSAPAVKASIEEFLAFGILKLREDISAGTHADITKLGMYRLTDKGRAWLSMILKTPYPKQVWIDQSGDIIKER